MKTLVSGLASGLVFGGGLALAGMTDPRVVLGFLDVAGAWNPALALVMVGALAVTAVGYRVVFRRARPVWAESFALPTSGAIDWPLIAGAGLFGVGWGLSGYCPGPALAALSGGWSGVVVFVAAMTVGLGLVRLWRAQRWSVRL